MLRQSITICCILGALISTAHPQSSQSSSPEIYGEPDGITGTDCESTMMRLDFIAIAADQPSKDQTIIIIARLGRGERVRTLNRRRLAQVADYLTRRVSKDRIISAEGERISGLGQLEFYVGGRLHTIFKVRRNRDLVRGCAEVNSASVRRSSENDASRAPH